MQSITSLVALFVLVGISAIPCHVEAGRAIMLAPCKDSTLYYGYRGYCNAAAAKSCKGEYAACPWCNNGKEKNLVVQQFEMQSDIILGFNLKDVKATGLKSCKLILPAAVDGGSIPGSGANIKLTDVGYKWEEMKVTYEKKPKPTAVGAAYGCIDPCVPNVVDVTASCMHAVLNRKTCGNGVAFSLTMNNTGIAEPYFVINYPAKESGNSIKLQVTYY